MDGLAVRGLVKSYETNSVAVDCLDLTVGRGEFLTLLGPSGCGKTTTLRCIAGLESPDTGDIEYDGTVFVARDRGIFVPPGRRQLGMVFQSYALWPHMRVISNVAYPMKRSGRTNRTEISARAREILAAMGLDGLQDRFPAQLSGGQQQRVALARALVNRPSLLLLDEPLSNLDARLRIQMRSEIRRLHNQFGTTSIYVTHDQTEALALSDRVVIMDHGRIQQVGSPADIYRTPANRFVADFVGFENIFSATVLEVNSSFAVIQAGDADVRLRCRRTSSLKSGSAVAIAARSGSLRLSRSLPDGHNTFPATVTQAAFLGESTVYTLLTPSGTLTSTIPAGYEEQAEDTGSIAPGDSVYVSVRPDDLVPLIA